LKVTSEHGENCEVTLTIEVEPERVEAAVQKAARKISQQANIPGFRRGKAPFHIVLQMFGREALLEEAVEDLGQTIFKEALEETKIEPYAPAEMLDVKLDPMVLKLRVPVAPKVDLGDYRALRLEPAPIEVTDEDVETEIEALRDRNSAWVPVERGAQWGDLVTMLVTQGDEPPAETPEPVNLVLAEGRQYPAPGFAEGLIGAVAGETRAIGATFPEDWHNKSQAGQSVTFHVTVQEIKEKEFPSLEELPAIIGDFDSLDALKTSVRVDLEGRQRERNDAQLTQKAMEVLMEQANFQYPKEYLEEELDSVMRRLEESLKEKGLDMDSYLKVLKLSRDEYREQQRPEAIKRARRGLILGKLAEMEKLDVKTDEVVEEIETRVMPFAEDRDKMRDLLMTPAGMSFVASEVMTDKVYQRLLAIVKGEAPDLPAEEPAAEEATAEEPAPEEAPSS